MFSKIWEKFIKSILTISSNSISTYGDETFNFMYRRCYTNTVFIANSDHKLASSVLKNFCSALPYPSKTKKCLEAIALIKQANPNLVILQGWIDEKWAIEFLPTFLSKIPQSGEKLAWCGALAITEGLFHIHLQFTIPFDDPLVSNDPLLVLFINRLLEQLKINLSSIENNLTDQIYNEISNVNRLKLKSEGIFNDYQNETVNSIQNECNKIKFIFKNIPDANLSFLPSSPDKINALFSMNENVKSPRSNMDKLFIEILGQLNALQFSLSPHSQTHFQTEFDQIKSKVYSEIEIQFKSIFQHFSHTIDSIQGEIKNNYYLQSVEFYNKNYVRPIKESNDHLITKISQCKAIFDTYTSQIQHTIPEATLENFNYLLERQMPLDLNELNIHPAIHKKMQKELSLFTEKNFQIQESVKNRHLKEKNKELKKENKFLILKAKGLEEKLKCSEDLILEKKEIEERNDLQIAHLIQQDIENLTLFQTLPPRSHWSQAQQKGWVCIIGHLKEIETLTQPSPKQFRNWERKDAWRLLELAGFQAKGELDGSHLEICHPLFSIHESVSFNTQKQTAIRLMKSYFESVHEVLELWYHEITKKKQIPFGQ